MQHLALFTREVLSKGLDLCLGVKEVHHCARREIGSVALIPFSSCAHASSPSASYGTQSAKTFSSNFFVVDRRVVPSLPYERVPLASPRVFVHV